MKNIYILSLFLLSAISLSAQKFEYTKGETKTAISVSNADSLLQPYKDRGAMTQYYPKDYKQKNVLAYLKKDVLSEKISNKIKGIKGSLVYMIYFDKEGHPIDITLSITNAIFEKLNEDDIRYIYNQLMKKRIKMEFFRWYGNFNYAHCINDLLRE